MTFDNLIALHEMLWPDTNLEQQLAKFEEELKELKEAEYNTEESLYELADMVIVSAGIARFNYASGMEHLTYTIEASEFDIVDIWQAVEKKMEKNRRRVWEKQNGMYQHKAGIED